MATSIYDKTTAIMPGIVFISGVYLFSVSLRQINKKYLYSKYVSHDNKIDNVVFYGLNVGVAILSSWLIYTGCKMLN